MAHSNQTHTHTGTPAVLILITRHCAANLKRRQPHTDPPTVGIRSPIVLVVGSCTSHPGVLGSIPKREEPGKTCAPCVKVPGSSRVPVRDGQDFGVSRLVHADLGSSSLVAHVLHSPPPNANSFVIILNFVSVRTIKGSSSSCSNKTHTYKEGGGR